MLTMKVSQQYIAKAKIPFIGITMERKKIKLDSTLKIGDIYGVLQPLNRTSKQIISDYGNQTSIIFVN